jgi:regulator of sigma E protease
MNMILPFFFLPVVYMMGVEVPAYRSEPPVIGWIEPESAAEKAGLQPGDLIVAINDSAVETWEKVETRIAENPENKIEMTVARNDSTVETELTPEQEPSLGSGYAGLGPQVDPVVGAVTDGYPAAKAGMQEKDRIIAIQGNPVSHWYQIPRLIEKYGTDGASIDFTVQRGGETLHMTIAPTVSEGNGGPRPVIGISPDHDMVIEQYGFFSSIVKGGERVLEVTGFTFYVLKQLVTLQLSMKALGGPILIAKATGHAAESGLANLLGFVAFLSINLAILNILPIPILDGGHLFFFLIEFIRGKPLGVKKMEMAQQVGFAVLILLMVVVTYNDILRLLPENLDKLLPWK